VTAIVESRSIECKFYHDHIAIAIRSTPHRLPFLPPSFSCPSRRAVPTSDPTSYLGRPYLHDETSQTQAIDTNAAPPADIALQAGASIQIAKLEITT
jgi:hypothetical protein